MRLLIVDDDYQIREGMKNGIEWEDIGITEVETCANGLEAIEAVKENMPDIIVADIQMPGITGLEMMSRILKMYSKVRIIFISAYSEFEYCRQALLLGANDYVLKPIQMDEFMNVIQRNIQALNEEKNQFYQYKKAVIQQSAAEIYEYGNLKELDAFFENIIEQYPYMKSEYYLTAFIQTDENDLTEGYKKEVEDSLRIHMDEKMVFVSEHRGGFIGLAPGNNSALATMYIQTSLGQKLKEWNDIYVEKYGTISGGISHAHNRQNTIAGYEQAYQASQLLFYHKKGEVLVYCQDEMMQEIPKEIKGKLDRKKMNKDFLEEFGRWAKDVKLKPAVFKDYLIEFYWDICRKNHSDVDVNDLRRQMESCRNAEECLQKIEESLNNPITKFTSGQEKTYSHTVSLALDFMEKHYFEQIAVGDVAEAVGKSPNYFSGMFKKEIGKPFTKYLNEIRLGRAYWLLLHTNKQVSEISEEIGYTDYIYFSQLFRRQFGCSASEIRNQNNKQY